LLKKVDFTKKENEKIDYGVDDSTPEFEQLKKENTVKVQQKY